MRVIIAELHETFRQLWRHRGFSLLVIGVLATGLGATVAIFSLLHSLVLSPLPFHEPARLVGIQSVNVAKGLVQDTGSVADHRDFARQAHSFASAGAFRPNFAAYVRPGEPSLRLVTGLVTPGLIDTLAVAPALGRRFQAEEFSAAAPRVVILSHAAWRRLFQGEPDVLGRIMLLDDEPCTVVGIMPEHFREPAFVDAWLPFPEESPEYFVRDSRFWTMIARLAPGVAPTQAQAELATIATALAREHPDTNRDWSTAVVPLQELRTRHQRPALLLLLGAVLLVLVIACFNLANLLLARGLARLPEIATRLALGATPLRLAGRMLAECLLLAVIGAAAGCAAAWAAVRVIANQLPSELVPRAHEAAIHPAAFVVAGGLAILCALVCGLLPAWQVWRLDVDAVLKQGAARGPGRAASRWQAALIIGQVALSVTVLAGALLLLKSLQRLQQVPLGFDAEHVVTLRLSPPPQRYATLADLGRYYQDLLDVVTAVPGVSGAAVNASAPLSGISLTYPTWIAGRGTDAAAAQEAVYSPVSDGYFELLRQPLVAGRTFTRHDAPRGALVAIVNETYARRAFPGLDPLGQRVRLLPWMGDSYREIVGVVADTLQDDLARPPAPQVYVPQQQMPWFFSTLLIKLERPGVISAVQSAVRTIDPTLPFAPRRWTDEIAETATQPRMYAQVFAGFAGAALALSTFGLYASLRFTLRQRRREIGVRTALGATPGGIARWMIGHAGRWVLAGIALGLLGAVPLALALRQQLFGVSVLDPVTFGLLPALVVTIATVAALPTAWRAARVPPVEALRAD